MSKQRKLSGTQTLPPKCRQASPLSDVRAAAPPILYVTYDGLTDPLGRSQVLPYLVGSARLGHRIHVLSCEKPERFTRDRATVEAICASVGIAWHPLPYHKAPPVLSTIYDMRMLRRAATRLHRRHRFALTHCRSYIGGAIGLYLNSRYHVALLFDMRGFWAEEKIESGSWNPSNPLFRLVYAYFKRLESKLLRNAGAIVALTEAAKAELLRRPELNGRSGTIRVIPCCVDFTHFPLTNPNLRAAARAALGIGADVPVLCYLGSLGGNYMLGEMLDFFAVYRSKKPRAVFLFVTQESATWIRGEAAARGFSGKEMVIRAAAREEVPSLLAAADVAIAFKQPSFSAKGCSPTKMGELLAIGLPLIANEGVGDVAEIIKTTACGTTVKEFDSKSYIEALERIEQSTSSAAERRSRAIVLYDIELGIKAYDEVYRRYSPRVT